MTPPMDEPQSSSPSATPLGEKLRQRRKAMKLTLQQVADEAGFTAGFISQIERGITVPSLTSLVSVCRVLDADIGSFLSQPKNATPITRHSDRRIYGLSGDDKNAVRYERLSASFPGNVLRSTIIHEPPGYRSEPMAHEGEEIFYIISGALTIEIEGTHTILEAGDTAHFPSTMTHTTWNHTTGNTVIFHTCTMDVFGDGDDPDASDRNLIITRAAKRADGANG
ncbi:XRE family transcriptional regulator [uncultured Martelella sp.]|uniref:helix-turn-helix domain-containing protein n=1 Tax=uncultured Martelella sp. TaxID=392331 RepID=UPI0029C97179|nr:XRE family transcriptional regulator [uncultured Martelella sp.]